MHNEIDDIFTKVFDKARAAVEGQKRSLPFSEKKLRTSNEYQYWKLKAKQLAGKRINIERMNRRRELAQINDHTTSIEEVNAQLKSASEKWKEFKMNAERHREEYLLDYHQGIIEEGETQEIEEKRRKAIKNVKRKIQRNQSFHYLTTKLGKSKTALNKLIIKEGKKSRTTHDRKEIETMLIRQNRNHLSKAMNAPACNDKIIKNLHKDSVRDKILRGELTREDVDNENVCEFLSLLALETKEIKTKTFNPMTLEGLKSAIKKSKKRSVSSVFSKRAHVVCKMVIDNDEFLEILILFYNLVIIKGIVLDRWRNTIDAMLDKGKGPLLGKLRIIELIEGDLQLIIRSHEGQRNDENTKKITSKSIGINQNTSKSNTN